MVVVRKEERVDGHSLLPGQGTKLLLDRGIDLVLTVVDLDKPRKQINSSPPSTVRVGITRFGYKGFFILILKIHMNQHSFFYRISIATGWSLLNRLRKNQRLRL